MRTQVYVWIAAGLLPNIEAFVPGLSMATSVSVRGHQQQAVDRELVNLKERNVGSAPWIGQAIAQNNIIKLKRAKAEKGITGGTSKNDPEVIPWLPRASVELKDVSKRTSRRIFGLDTGGVKQELDHVSLQLSTTGATMVVLENQMDGGEMFLKLLSGQAKPTEGEVSIDGIGHRQVLYINGKHDFNERKRVDENIQAVLNRVGGVGGRLATTCLHILELAELEPKAYTQRACDLSGTDALKFELAMKLAEAAAMPLPPLLVVEPQDTFLDLHFMDKRIYGKFFGLLHRLSRDKGIKVVYAVDSEYMAYMPADDVVVLREGQLVEHSSVDQSHAVRRRRDEEGVERMKALLGDWWKPIRGVEHAI